MDEFDFIHQALRPLASHPGAHGLYDDGASLPTPPQGSEWRVSTDTLVAGVHFRAGDALDGVAWRGLATATSDLVAQLSRPQFYLLNLSAPSDFDAGLFAAGLSQAQTALGLSLLGGDTTATPGPLTLSFTVLGLGEIGKNPLRSRARVGQHIGLICAPHGPLGSAKAGFEGKGNFAAAYLRPQPCLSSLDPLMGASSLGALADISDGIVQDLGHICVASGVGAELQLSTLPVALPQLPKLPQITWGDDYGLIITAEVLPDLPDLHHVGKIVVGQGVKLLDAQGHEIPVMTPGYVHHRPL